METLFKPGKDEKVSDLTFDPGFDTEPLLKHFGHNTFKTKKRTALK